MTGTGTAAYATRGCVLAEGPWLDESGPSTHFLRFQYPLNCNQRRRRDLRA